MFSTMTNIRSCSVNDMNVTTEALPHAQAPGFQRVRIGELLVTALYDGFVPVLADDLHGERRARISRLLAEAFLDPVATVTLRSSPSWWRAMADGYSSMQAVATRWDPIGAIC